MNVALYIRRSTIDLQPDSLTAKEELLRAHATAHARARNGGGAGVHEGAVIR